MKYGVDAGALARGEILQKTLKLVVKISLVLLLLIFMVSQLYRGWTTSYLPHVNICRTLGSVPKLDPRCRNAGGLFSLIEERFPLGTTSPDEVKHVLHDYLVDSSSDLISGNSRDSYGITPLLFSNAIVEFYFDERGMLIKIYFID